MDWGREIERLFIAPSQWHLSMVLIQLHLHQSDHGEAVKQTIRFYAVHWKHRSVCPVMCTSLLSVPTEVNECTLLGRVLPPGPSSICAACLCGPPVKCMKCLSCHCFIGDRERQEHLLRLRQNRAPRAVPSGGNEDSGAAPQGGWAAGRLKSLQMRASRFTPRTFACFLCELRQSEQLIPLAKGVN